MHRAAFPQRLRLRCNYPPTPRSLAGWAYLPENARHAMSLPVSQAASGSSSGGSSGPQGSVLSHARSEPADVAAAAAGLQPLRASMMALPQVRQLFWLVLMGLNCALSLSIPEYDCPHTH